MAETLLVVEDDLIARKISQSVLEKAGYAVEVAEDGEVAWEKILASPDRYHLILLDKHMPRLDGIGFLKRLKANQRYTDLPVVMLTGDKLQQGIIECLNAGAYYYLTKPSPEAFLLQVVRNALYDWRQKNELRAEIGRRVTGVSYLNKAEFSIRTIEEARELALVLADLSYDAMRTVSGYSELLVNAVEHGNLEISYQDKTFLMAADRWRDEVALRLKRAPYAARKVRVEVVRDTRACAVTITDEGGGFDWQKYLEFDPARAFDLHGRGIAMSKAMSFDDVRYIGKGNKVIVMSYAHTRRENTE